MKIRSIKSRRVLYLVLLLLLTALYFLNDPFRSFLTRIIFLLTAQSREILTGYLQAAGPKPLRFTALMVTQAVIAPFRWEPLTFAGVRAFGLTGGLLLSILGRFLGAWLTFDIGRVFLAGISDRAGDRLKTQCPQKSVREGILVNILFRMLPLPFDLMSYLAGGLRLHEKKYLITALLWIAGTTSAHAVRGGYFSSALEGCFLVLRIMLSLILLGLLLHQSKGKTN